MEEHHSTVDKYISTFPEETQQALNLIRNTIQKMVPEASETVSYGIPTFKLKGNLVHYAGYKNHIGFYPGAAGIEAFQQEISKYKNAKGSVQFPLNQPLPLSLIRKITEFAVARNLKKAELKHNKDQNGNN